MESTGQRELFGDQISSHEGDQRTSMLSRDSSLQAALGTFERHMQDEGFSINTVKAFASDIRLLGRYMGIGTPIGEIGTKNLNDYLHWLTHERGVPCSPKSYARRVTTLKVFLAGCMSREFWRKTLSRGDPAERQQPPAGGTATSRCAAGGGGGCGLACRRL